MNSRNPDWNRIMRALKSPILTGAICMSCRKMANQALSITALAVNMLLLPQETEEPHLSDL